MKSFWLKNRSTIIVAIITAIISMISAITISIMQKKINEQQETISRSAEIVMRKQVEYIDEYNRAVTIVTEQRTTIQEYLERLNSGDKLIKKLTEENKASGIKIERIEHTGIAVSDYTDTVYVLVGTDSLRQVETECYKDNWTEICREKKWFEDSSKWVINQKDSLIFTGYWYKYGKWKFKNIFKPREKRFMFSVKNLNPSVKITYLNWFTFVKKRERRREE